MMGQRRRMLYLTDNYDQAFSTITYVTSGGNNEDSSNYAQISVSSLESDKVYYIFGYCEKNFTVYKYYNGNITTLYAYNKNSTYSIGFELNTSVLRLRTGTSDKRRCHGMTAFSFGISMDSFFTDMNLICSDGLLTAGSEYYWPMNISQFHGTGTEYLFGGCAERFCIYKLNGTEIQNLQLIFSHNLYLRDYYGDTTQLMISETPTGSPIRGWGSTVFSIRRR